MICIEDLQRLASEYEVPLEDVLFIALNRFGVNMDVAFNRMRMAFRLNGADPLFAYAAELCDLDYYFALPVNQRSPFRIRDQRLSLMGQEIGVTIGATEDYCDSHYPRRRGTSLNINPNSRTSCRGCEFCYTAYQVPCDLKRMRTEEEIRAFFGEWIKSRSVPDLSHLIQVSVVTGCYDDEDQLTAFLLALSRVLRELQFGGKVFYLGSMLTSSRAIRLLSGIPSFGYCMSLECFSRRELLRGSKQRIAVATAKDIMRECTDSGMEVNYTYIAGIEPIAVFLPCMEELLPLTSKFPTVNILQLHQQHRSSLMDPAAATLPYFIQARLSIENLYRPTAMRPLVWEDYRSLWYLRFGTEVLRGWRVPE